LQLRVKDLSGQRHATPVMRITNGRQLHRPWSAWYRPRDSFLVAGDEIAADQAELTRSWANRPPAGPDAEGAACVATFGRRHPDAEALAEK